MSLVKKVQTWIEKDFITADQGSQIIEFEKQRNTGFFLKASFTLAGTLIGLGLCLIVASNWAMMSELPRIICIFAIFGAFIYGAYYYTAVRPSKIKELFLTLCFLMTGATIGLIGQIFNLEGGWRNFALAWGFLSLPYIIFSRIKVVNIAWVFLIASCFNFGFWEKVFDYIKDRLDGFILLAIAFFVLSYAFKITNKEIKKITIMAEAVSDFLLLMTYICLVVGGLYWQGVIAHVVVLLFLAGRMLWGVKIQDISLFKRNAVLAELYIFAIFVTCFGNLFMSGVGFVIGGLVILGFIKILKKTMHYIKNMEVFHA